MRVILARSAGFCYGVERAVKLAEQTAREKGGCVMLGSIIHNAHVVQELEALGARQVEDASQVRPGETVIIRSHGEKKQVYEALAAAGADIVDATCPNVRRIQRLVAGPGRRGARPSSSVSSTIRRSWARPAGRRPPSSWTGPKHWKNGFLTGRSGAGHR